MHDLPDAGWDVPDWMLAKIVNDYFAGWEPITLGATDEEFHETVNESLRIASCAAQTDFCQCDFAGPPRRQRRKTKRPRPAPAAAPHRWNSKGPSR